MEPDCYLTIKSPSEGIYKDKGSKFFAYAFPISSENEAKTIIESFKKRYHDARHRCFAYHIASNQPIQRANDDGEPSNSAGKPILNQIIARGLCDILVIVVRYFGGTLLGVGGLINAYRESASDALNHAEVIKVYRKNVFSIQYPFSQTNGVLKIIKEMNGAIIHQQYDNDCLIDVAINTSLTLLFTEKIAKIEGVKINLSE